MKIDKLLKIGMAICLCIAGFSFVIAKSSAEDNTLIIGSDTYTNESSDLSFAESDATSSASDIKTYSKSVYVHVCGAVKNPGLYELEDGSRIQDAIKAAGGFSEEADETYLNLAQLITDSQQIKVPTISEALSKSAKEIDEASGIVNINTANVSQLMTLPGIGQVRAEAIIAYRNENGNFEKKTDIMKVSGIGESAYNNIKDKIKIDSS